MAPSTPPFAGGDRKFFTLEKFATLNTKNARPSIGDQEFSWIENMMPIGDGNLRAMPSNGSSIFTAPGGLTIIYMYFYNIGSTTYAAIFLNDGTATQVNLVTQAQTVISANPGQFFPGSAALNNPAPACAQYGQSGIIIVTTASTNGYYAWDGTTLYGPGSAAPDWLTDTTPTTMPSGISGTCVETYSNRVWVGFGANRSQSAPGNGADFSGADGGGTAPSTDSFLRREITQLKQSNGFLYQFADSSVNVISNVQTSGSPVATTYNNQNVDPQVGSPYHNSVQAFGRGLVFAHNTGVYALVGGAAEKVSDMLDGIYLDAAPFLLSDTAIEQPSAAIMTIYDIKVYLLLMPLIDPFSGNERMGLVMWDGKKWFLGSQDSSLIFIASQEINSSLQAYGTDGVNVFPLFSEATDTLRKIWQTRLWPGDGFQITKQAMRLYTLAQDNSGEGYTITGTVDYVLENAGLQTHSITINSSVFAVIWQNASSQTVQWQNASSQNVNWTVVGLSLSGFDAGNINQRGNLLGLTLQSTSPDFTLVSHSLLYQNQSPLGA
jgi:hypothetical protein